MYDYSLLVILHYSEATSIISLIYEIVMAVDRLVLSQQEGKIDQSLGFRCSLAIFLA